MTRERKSLSEDRVSRSALEFFGTIPAIEQLLDIEAFSTYAKQRAKVEKLDDYLSLGYAFVLGVLIDHLIFEMNLSPEIVGFKRDKDVEAAEESSHPYWSFPSSSEQGKFIKNLGESTRLLLSVRTFEDFERQTEPLRKWLIPSLKELARFYIVSEKALADFGSLDNILRIQAEVNLLKYCHWRRLVSAAHNHLFGRRKETFLDKLAVVYDRKWRFFEGYKLGLTYLWVQFQGVKITENQSYRALEAAADWDEFEEEPIYRGLQSAYVTPLELALHQTEEKEPILRMKRQVPKRIKDALTSFEFPRKETQTTPEKILDESFLWEEVRTVDAEDTNRVAMGFWVAVKGTMNVLGGKIQVRKFVHNKLVSYAVRLHKEIFIYRYSVWWLFYSFCSIEESSDIDKDLQMQKRVELQIIPIGAEDLWRYAQIHNSVGLELTEKIWNSPLIGLLEGREFQRSRIELFEKVVAEADWYRGAILELLALVLLQENYRILFWRFQNKRLFGRMEIDGILLDRNEENIYVMECSADFSQELYKRLKKRMEALREHKDEILHSADIRFKGDISVKGIIITTDLRAATPSLEEEGILVWNRKRLEAECKKLGIPWNEIEPIYPLRHQFSMEDFPSPQTDFSDGDT